MKRYHEGLIALGLVYDTKHSGALHFYDPASGGYVRVDPDTGSITLCAVDIKVESLEELEGLIEKIL